MSNNISATQMEAERSSRSQQDKKVPFLINRNNGRLLPNTQLLRKHKDLVPYTGSVKASLDERMRYLRTGSTRTVTASKAEELPPFDVSMATKDELIEFAKQEFDLELNPDAPIHIMRKQIIKASGQPELAEPTLG